MGVWFVRLAGIGITKSAVAVTGATASTGRRPGRRSRPWPGSARADRPAYCASISARYLPPATIEGHRPVRRLAEREHFPQEMWFLAIAEHLGEDR
jgi:hypothetical protein